MSKHAIAVRSDNWALGRGKRPPRSKWKSSLHATAVGIVSTLALGMLSTHRSTYTIGIYGDVPTICHADLNGAAVGTSEGLVDLGTMVEFCNDGAGYQVWLETIPNVPGGSVYVDHAEFPLAASGGTLIHQSDSAARRTSHLTLYVGGARIQRVTVRLVPL